MPPDQSIPDPSQPVPDQFDLICESCGYSLVGLTTDRCPECGHVFDPTELPLARIPWLFRKRYGISRAYILTVAMILIHPIRFAREITRPVRLSAADARMFRRTTIWLTLLLIFIIALVFAAGGFLVIYRSFGPPPRITTRHLIVMILYFPAGILGSWVFLWLASDLPTFIWKGLPANPDDLAPLHHYTIAPIGLLPAGAVIAAAMGILAGSNHDLEHGLAAAGMVLLFFAGVIALIVWIIALLFMRVATGCSFFRQLLLAAYLPIHWAMIALLSFMLAMLIIYPFVD